MQWYVLYVKPRTEKKTAEFCRRCAIGCYLPLRRRIATYKRNKIQSWLPVFPGYLFVGLSPVQRLVLQDCRHVVRFIQPRSNWSLLRQLVFVRRALRADPELATVRQVLRVGRRVRITGGPFRGVEGVIGALRAKTRVLVQVDFMQQAILVETPREDLELFD